MARDFDLAKLLTDDGLRTTVNIDVSFDANTLYVDADTNRVGVNTNAPGYTLEVNGSLNSTNLYIGGTQVTSTATELNVLDGITATVTELNYTDGVTSNLQTQLDAKLPLAGGTMTGNIVMAGAQTVDGRDLSADGTKLDGIETGATADQTASEILTALLTVDGTTSGLDADLLDGQHGSYYAPISGPSFTGNITLTGEIRGPSVLIIDPAVVSDNTGLVIIKGDLQIDGTTTTINSTTLEIDDKNIILAANSVNAAAADGAGITVDGASATLTYVNSGDKWQFNKSVDVTGTVTADGLLVEGGAAARPTFTHASGYGALQVAGTGASSGAGIIFANDYNTAVSEEYSIYLDGATDSLVFISGDPADIATEERMRIDASGNVGIGTTASVGSNSTGEGFWFNAGEAARFSRASNVALIVNRITTTGDNVHLRYNGSNKGLLGFDGTSAYFNTGTSTPLAFKIDSSTKVTIDSSGNVFVAGKTSLNDTQAGHALSGGSNAGLTYHTRDGGLVMSLSRLTSDGDILRFVGSGNVVGTIGASGGSAYFGGYQNAGIYFNGTTDIRPWNTSTQANLDNSIDLGTSAGRFKDLYLSSGIKIVSPDTTSAAAITFGDSADSATGSIGYFNSDDSLRFSGYNNSERMRIDSSGHLMIGTTDNLPYTNNDASGIALRADGNAQFSRSGAATARFNRGTSDGEIVSFGKDGTTIGTIESSVSQLVIKSSSSNLVLIANSGSNNVITQGALRPLIDNTDDLGTSTRRWQDLYLSGNITVGGTVDGRDVATDGTKLDGIETGATADQTASEILTALLTVDGAGSGLDADLLDGISSASFVRSDADDTLSGVYTIYKATSTTGATGTTLLTLSNYVGSDLGQEKTFIDFTLTDDNSNETPQVRIGAEVGQNGNADSQAKEGSGAFVVYTNNADTNAGAAGASLAERFRVDYLGNVGIGTSSPQTKFVVSASDSQNIEISGSWIQSFNRSGSPGYASMGFYASSYAFNNGAVTVNNGINGQFTGTITASGSGDSNQPFRFNVDYSGWAQIFSSSWTSNNGWGTFWAGNDNPAYSYFSTINPNEYVFVGAGNTRASIDLDNGNAYFGGTVSAASDERLKTDIKPIDNALDIALALEGKRYIKDDKQQVGVIAQQVEKILPEVVTTSEVDGYKSVNYSNIVAVLIEAIKEQQKQIDELRSKLDGN